MGRCCSAPRSDRLCLLRGRLSPRRAPGGSSRVPGAAAVAPCLVMSGKAVSAHRDITALFSLLFSCPIVPVTAVLPECFHLFLPFYFFFPHFVHWVWYDVLFFSLSLSLAFFLLSFWLALSLSACYTPPLLGKALVWYHITADPGISGRRAEADGQPVRLCVPSLCPPSSRILQLWEPG